MQRYVWSLCLNDQNKSNFLIEGKRKRESVVYQWDVGDSGMCRDIRAHLLPERSNVITPKSGPMLLGLKSYWLKSSFQKLSFTIGRRKLLHFIIKALRKCIIFFIITLLCRRKMRVLRKLREGSYLRYSFIDQSLYYLLTLALPLQLWHRKPQRLIK